MARQVLLRVFQVNLAIEEGVIRGVCVGVLENVGDCYIAGWSFWAKHVSLSVYVPSLLSFFMVHIYLHTKSGDGNGMGVPSEKTIG